MPIYLDHNATSPPRPEVLSVALPLITEHWGNPSSSHSLSRRPVAAVEEARRRLAEWGGVRPREVIFTGGATEANQLALRGLRPRRRVLFSALEHPSVRVNAEHLGGGELPVDAEGRLDLDALEAALDGEPALVSVMAANNELGVLQDLEAIAERVHAREGLLHVDAAQVIGRIEAPRGWDLCTVTGHKAGGLKGAGALLLREGVRIEAQAIGGGQERGLRSGTVNPAPIASLGVVSTLRYPSGLEQLRARVESVGRELGGQVLCEQSPRLPNTVSLRFPGIPGAVLVAGLDLEGVCISAGSACHSGAATASACLQAIGVRSADVVRLSLGWDSQAEALEQALASLRRVVERSSSLREVG